MRLDKNRWQEGAGLFIKKANANPYSVVAAYLGELEKIGNSRLTGALARLEEAAAKRVEAGLKVGPELEQQIRGLRSHLSPDAKAVAREVAGVPGDPGEWSQGGLRMLGRREELPAAARARHAPARVDVSERAAIPAEEADVFRPRRELLAGEDGVHFSRGGDAPGRRVSLQRPEDVGVRERPASLMETMPESAVAPLDAAPARGAPPMHKGDQAQGGRVLSDDPIMRAWQDKKINIRQRERLMAERAARAAPQPEQAARAAAPAGDDLSLSVQPGNTWGSKSVADIYGPSANLNVSKPASAPQPREQNVMFGSAADGGTVPASKAVADGRVKASDPHVVGQKADLTTDPPAQMAPQPVAAPNPPADLAGGAAANNPMAPTPEAPVAVAPVWKRRAALAGAGTLAAGGAFAAGYGGRQVIQPQQGQR